jgi:predicted alpha/beta hydrolase
MYSPKLERPFGPKNMNNALHEVQVPAADGFLLGGSHFGARANRGAVVLAPATGVPRNFYAGFAKNLAMYGFSTLIFDYRGVGESRPGKLNGFQAAMHDWGELDLEGALRWMHAQHPSVPQFVIGHSAGAQLIGLAPASERPAGMVTIASGGGYWKLWPALAQPWMFANWYLLIPALSHLVGYLPMKALGQGENLPKGVALEWARWGRQPDYLLTYVRERGIERYRELRQPLLSLSFTDDSLAPREAVKWLMRIYENAEVAHREFSPRELGQKQIGHFGFFKARFRETLWRELIDWLGMQANTHLNGVKPLRA